MRRQFNRAALLFTAAIATTGCASLGLGSADNTAAKPAPAEAAQDTPQSPYAAEIAGLPHDLDGEIRRAQLLRAQGDFRGAIKALSQLMLVAPDDPRIVGEYGKVLAQIGGRTNDSLAFLNRAIELQSDNWTFYSALGVAYDQKGDAAKAEEAYKHALALKPENPTVLNNYAMSQMQAGHLAHAEKLLREAAVHGGDYPKIANNLAMIAAMRGEAAPSASQSAVKPQPMQDVASARPPAQTRTLGAPRALAGAAASAAPKARVVMQAVPYDPLAGKHYGKAAPQTPAQHLAQADAPAKAATHARQSAAQPQVPPLRTAADIY